MIDLVDVKYTGKHAAVSVGLPSGRKVAINRGETVLVSVTDSVALVALPGFSRVTVPTVSEES